MNKTKFLSALLVSTLLFFGAKTFAADFTQKPETGYISVTTSMSKEVAPDRANIRFYIETIDKNVQKATELNKNASNAVINALRPLIANNPKDMLQTSSFNVSPQYFWTKDNKKVLDNYMATNSIRLSTFDVNNVGQYIDAALKAGANRVDSFELTLDNQNKYCNKFLSEATKTAYGQATAVASAVNAKILGIKYINTSCSLAARNMPYRVYMNAKAAMSDATGAVPTSTPIESGKINIEVTIDADYYVK